MSLVSRQGIRLIFLIYQEVHMHIKSPCHHCDKRYLGCHDVCKDYLDYRLALDNFNKSVREAKEKDKILPTTGKFHRY